MKNACKKILALALMSVLLVVFAACQPQTNPEHSSLPVSDGEQSSNEQSGSSSQEEENSSEQVFEEASDQKTEMSSSASETSKPESSKPETSKPETSKPETSKPESSKPETSKPESSKPETSEVTSTLPDQPSGSQLFTLVKEALPSAGKVYIDVVGQIGRDDYASCTIRVEDPSGNFETINDTEAQIKVRGNSTADGAKKPYNIKFSKKTEVFGLGKAKKWCLLANMFDKSLIRNKLVYDMAQVIGVPYTSSSTYVDVYLNGKLMGCYQFCEAVGTGSTQVDIDTDGMEFLLEFEPWGGYENDYFLTTKKCGIILGYEDPEEPTLAQRVWLEDFLAEAETALLAGDYEEICQYWDVESIVNDYILHEYFKCVDATTSSARYFVKEGKIHGGPAWDFDLSSGNADKEFYKTYYPNGKSYEGWWCRGIWYHLFFRLDWFEEMVKDRFMELQPVIENLTDDNSLGKNRIDALQETYGDSFKKNFAKDGAGWKVYSVDSPFEGPVSLTYEGHIKNLRQWLRDRNEWMKEAWKLNE